MSAKVAIVVVGFGNMGQALVRGWLAKGRAASSIRVVDPADAARAAARDLGVALEDGVAAADVVLLAVKPNQLAEVLPRCSAATRAGAVFLSIAAGKTLAEIGKGLGGDAAIVRAMPNTPAAIGHGITALVANAAVSGAQRALCGELLAAVGSIAWLDEERHMDAVTAVSGSGPAYVFLLIECLEQAAVELGLGAALARQLALATVAGSGAYAARSGEAPAELRRRVTSPKGTTQAALDVLMAEPGMRELLVRATRAAAERSRELAKA
ncbi:MAG TPA: pyrroline-5-carboxylate reductase [Rhodanobacteraceae bacterium]|nr:pyrroline-5-carboxylate reductase [Rhodanobacteraceae bacterium]